MPTATPGRRLGQVVALSGAGPVVPLDAPVELCRVHTPAVVAHSRVTLERNETPDE